MYVIHKYILHATKLLPCFPEIWKIKIKYQIWILSEIFSENDNFQTNIVFQAHASRTSDSCRCFYTVTIYRRTWHCINNIRLWFRPRAAPCDHLETERTRVLLLFVSEVKPSTRLTRPRVCWPRGRRRSAAEVVSFRVCKIRSLLLFINHPSPQTCTHPPTPLRDNGFHWFSPAIHSMGHRNGFSAMGAENETILFSRERFIRENEILYTRLISRKSRKH